jgi:hypothetical protein
MPDGGSRLGAGVEAYPDAMGAEVPDSVSCPRRRRCEAVVALGESRRSFDRLVPLLKDFRVYAPDLRGQGDAEKPEHGYSLVEQAEDAAVPLVEVHERVTRLRGPPSAPVRATGAGQVPRRT